MGALRSGTYTVLFTDLRDSTAIRVRMGDDAFDALRRRHDDALRALVAAHEGHIVKFTGDGVLCVFAASAQGVAAAVAAQQVMARLGLAIGVGISAGDVAVEDHDVHGTPVVEAARLCAVATHNQIVAADVVRVLTGSRGTHSFHPLGPLTLKGLPEPVNAFTVPWEAETAANTVTLPRELQISGATPFVGRGNEQARLDAAYRDAANSPVSVVFVSGEPGIGKTRLVAEFAHAAAASGSPVLFGHCEQDAGVAYQPFARALGDRIARCTDDEVRAIPTTTAAELVPIVPSMATRYGEALTPLHADPDSNRLRLFDAVADTLARWSHNEPLVVILDDLHWADKPSLLLLRHLLRSPLHNVLVVATYRDTDLDRTHPLAAMLADLRRVQGQQHERISLSGMDEHDVCALVARLGGQAEDDAETVALATTLHAETEGNPFFLGEVIRHLVETGLLSHDGTRWRVATTLDRAGVPEGVREAVGRRLSALDDATNQLLSIAALVGPLFDADVVASAADVSLDDALDALELAATRRLLVATDEGLGFAFIHALVRSTLLTEISAPRAMRWHRSIARALETRPGQPNVTELARHYRACAALGEHTNAIRYLTLAGNEARQQLAYEEAATHFANACELAELFELPPTELVPLLIGHGEALRCAGDNNGGTILLRAAELAPDDADVLVRVVLAFSNGGVMSTFAGHNQAIVDVCERALELLGPDEHARRAEVSSVAALELSLAGEPEALARGRRHATNALALIDGVDPATEGFVLANFYGAAHSDQTFDQLPAVGQRLLELGAQTGDGRFITAGHVAVAFAHFERGAIRTGLAALEELERAAMRYRTAFELFRAPAITAAVRAFDLGDVSQFESTYARALEHAQRTGVDESIVAGIEMSYRNVLAIVTGNGVPDITVALFLAEAAPANPSWTGAVAIGSYHRGELAQAHQWYERLAARGPEGWPRNFMWPATVLFAVDHGARLGRASDVARFVPLLEPLHGRAVFGGVLTAGVVDLARARAHALLGDHDRSMSAWRDARALIQREGLLRWEIDAHEVLWGHMTPPTGAEHETLRHEATVALERGRACGLHGVCDRLQRALGE